MMSPVLHCSAEMNGLPNFAFQIQSCFFLIQSKSNHSPKFFSNAKYKSKWSPNILKNAAFLQQKCRISFPSTQSQSGPVLNFEEIYTPVPTHKQTKFAIVRFQSKGGFTQNPVTAYDPAYGQRQSSHMQQEHHHRQHRQSGLLKAILKQF